MNKKIVILISAIALLLPLNAKAVTFKDNQVVTPNKNWVIRLNQDITIDDSVKKNIFVRNSANNDISSTALTYGQDHKTIIVNAPQGGYAGGMYSLCIYDGLLSSSNKKINKGMFMNFTVNDETKVTFKDKNFENAYRSLIKKPTGDITKTDVNEAYYISLRNSNIVDISDIELFPRNMLYNIDLSHNKINDISLLREFNSTNELELQYNEIKDVTPLSGMNKLEVLDLAYNDISDVSALQNLTNLKELDLRNNKISDIDKESLKKVLPNCKINF